MNGQEEIWSQQGQHQLQLFLGGVARNMYIGDSLVVHVGPLAEKVVDRAADHFLIARHWGSREDNRIVRLDTHQAMILVSNARKSRGWLSLAAGTDDDHALGRELVNVFGADERGLGNVQVSQVYCHLHVVDHTASNKRHHTLITNGGIDNLLDAVEQGCKSGDDNTSRSVRKNFIERLVDDSLRGCISRSFDTRAITHHHKNALAANTCQGAKISGPPVNGCVIELVVSGMEDRSNRCMDGKSEGVRHAVIDTHDFYEALP